MSCEPVTTSTGDTKHRLHGRITYHVAALLGFALVFASCGQAQPSSSVTATTATSALSTGAGAGGGGTATTTLSPTLLPSPTTATQPSTAATRRTTMTTGGLGAARITGGIGNVTAPSASAPSLDIQPGGVLMVGESTDIASGFDMNQVTTTV